MNYKGVKDKKLTCKGCGIEFAFRNYSDRGQYCSNACQGAKKYRDTLAARRKQFEQGQCKNRRWIYQLLVERDGNMCACCGLTEWNNKPIRLWVDHVDGNAANNSPKNFRLICPNCESQSATFGARNRGNGRKSRGLPMYG